VPPSGKYLLLDSGFVRVDRIDGTEKDIVRYARLRADMPTKATKEAIRFLFDHGFSAPFGLVGIVLEVRAPRFVKEHWFRNRASWRNEVVEATNNVDLDELEYALPAMLDPEYYCPPRDAVCKDVRDQIARDQTVLQHNRKFYRDFAPDHACINDPLSQYVEWYWRDNLWNLLQWLTLQRRHRPASSELCAYVDTLETIVTAHFPLTATAWRDHVEGIYLTRQEMEEVKELLWGKVISKYLHSRLYPVA
jgi:thymidylate synthase ThyX